MKLNLFETKEFTNPVYEGLAKTRGNTRSRTNVRYSSIAYEGYKRNSVVFACLEQIIKAAGQIKLAVATTNSDGKDVVIENHLMNQVLNQPNPMYGINEFKLRSILFYYIAGQAPIHFMNNVIGNLYTYRPDEVSFNSTGSDMFPYTNVFYTAGRWLPIPDEEFTIWKRYDPLDFLDGLGNGMSMLEPILKEIDQRNATKEWNISLLEEGARMSGVLSVPEILDETEFKRLDKQVQQKYRGKKNVGGIMLLDGGITFTETSVNPKDMDWIEGGKQVIKEICSGLAVDPILVGYNEYSTYNNKKEAAKELYTRNVIPLMDSLAEVLTLLFRRVGKIKQNQRVKIITEHIPALQPDLKETVERLEKAPYTLNEKRAELGKEEVKGGDLIVGDKYIIDLETNKTLIPINFIEMGENIPLPPDNRSKEDKKDFQY